MTAPTPVIIRNNAAMCRNFQTCSAVTSARRRSRNLQRLSPRVDQANGLAGAVAFGMPHRGADELAEERMRPVGARTKLGMELRANHERVVAQLANLDQRAVGRDAARDQAALFEDRLVGVVELVAV